MENLGQSFSVNLDEQTSRYRSLLQARLSEVLRELESLEPGWDGGSAEPVGPVNLELLKQVLPHTPLHIDFPTLMPVGDGRVDLIWDKAGLICTLHDGGHHHHHHQIVVHIWNDRCKTSYLKKFADHAELQSLLTDLIIQNTFQRNNPASAYA